MSELIVLGAFPPETKPFRSAAHGREDVSVFDVGVGMVAAAVATTRVLMTNPDADKKILFVGSVGSADESVPHFCIVSATEARLAEVPGAYFPEAQVKSLEADTQILRDLLPCEGEEVLFEPVYSTTAITEERLRADALFKESEARFENLELFGVAQACAAFDVPWASISLVSNHCGPNAHSEWKANHELAARKTAAWLFRTA